MWAERFDTGRGRLSVERPGGLESIRLCGLNRSGLQHKPSLAAAGFLDLDAELRAWRQGWNARVLRVPLALDLLLARETYRADVARLVAAAEGAGLYLILEFHGLSSDLSLALPPAEAFSAWELLAREHGQRPHVIFDLWNEPHDVGWDTWRARAQGLVDVVRAAGARDTLLLASGLDWGYDLRPLLEPANRLDGRGGPLAYAAHVYPFKTGHLRRRAACRRAFGRVADELPVIVTEFGVAPGRTLLARLLARAWLEGFLRYVDALGLWALAWAAGDQPHLVHDRNGQSVRLPDAPPDPGQPTREFGARVRTWLRDGGGSQTDA